MGLSHFPHGVSSFGIPTVGGYGVPIMFGRADYWFVDADTDSAGDGKSAENPFATIQAAVDAYEDDANPRRAGVILIAPREEGGGYDEAVTISNAAANSGRGNGLYLVGAGPRGSVFIANSTVGAEPMTVSQNNVTFINLGIEAEDTADFALRVFGARFRAYGCKFEGPTADVVRIGPETLANGAASGVLTGGDAIFYDCEFAWGGSGIVITSSDFGACTQTRIEKCLFHNLTAACIGENDAGAVGSGRNIWIVDNIFAGAEDGTDPTDWIDLDSAGTTGILTGNRFETTVFASATIQLAAGVLFVGNYAEQEGPATGGGTAGRPD